jgi:hypothetical protein
MFFMAHISVKIFNIRANVEIRDRDCKINKCNAWALYTGSFNTINISQFGFWGPGPKQEFTLVNLVPRMYTEEEEETSCYFQIRTEASDEFDPSFNHRHPRHEISSPVSQIINKLS